jgi:hypothetical protein
MGISDPPRDDAGAAVAACRSAGIDVKMIRRDGDHVRCHRVLDLHRLLTPCFGMSRSRYGDLRASALLRRPDAGNRRGRDPLDFPGGASTMWAASVRLP